MKLIVFIIFLFPVFHVLAQEPDSIRTRVLDDLVVRGVRFDRDTLDSFYRTNAAATTENVLSRLSGVSLIRRGSFGQEPIIRGLSNGQLNITIDGMKIFGACTDRMDPVTIYVEPVNLSGIQALTGADASRFGSTFGGSLNMTFAEPLIRSEPVIGRVGINVHSSARAINTFGALNFSRDKSAYRTSFTHRKNNNYHSGNGKPVRFSQYEKINVGLSGKWATGKTDTLSGDILFDRGWDIGFPALHMDVSQASAGIYAVTYQRVVPWFIFNSLRIKGYHNRITHTMDDLQRPDIAMHMTMPGRSSTTGIFTEGDLHWLHKHATKVRLEYFSNTVLGEMNMFSDDGMPMYMQTAPEATRQNAGLFFSQEFKIDSNSKVLITMRGDMFRDRLHDGFGKDQVEIVHAGETGQLQLLKTFGLSVKRKLSYRTTLAFQGGYGERIPTLNERFGFYLFNRFDGYDYMGKADISREHSFSGDATLSFFGRNFELQLTPFYKHIVNFIMGTMMNDYQAMTSGARGVKQYQNIMGAQMAGLDGTVLATPTNGLQWITTFKYLSGITTQNEPMPLIPPLKVVSSMRYTPKNLSYQFDWEWASAQNNVSPSFGEQRTPAYWLINMSASYRLKQWTLQAGIENILDVYYREHLDWGGVPRPGRNLFMSATVQF